MSFYHAFTYFLDYHLLVSGEAFTREPLHVSFVLEVFAVLNHFLIMSFRFTKAKALQKMSKNQLSVCFPVQHLHKVRIRMLDTATAPYAILVVPRSISKCRWLKVIDLSPRAWGLALNGDDRPFAFFASLGYSHS